MNNDPDTIVADLFVYFARRGREIEQAQNSTADGDTVGSQAPSAASDARPEPERMGSVSPCSD